MMYFRIDDVGASSKHFEQYGHNPFRKKLLKKLVRHSLKDFWILKKYPPLRKWGKYNELTAKEWETYLTLFKRNNITPIIAITAAWVNRHSNLTPFPDKFPKQAKILKDALQDNIIEIANHGLTHCVVGKHLPLFNASNRDFHREFWPELDSNIHEEHIKKSQYILENYFEKPITIFVPPGNVWSSKTYQALKMTNIKTIMSNRYMIDSDDPMDDIEFHNDKNDFAYHDRELKLYGRKWLIEKINQFNCYAE